MVPEPAMVDVVEGLQCCHAFSSWWCAMGERRGGDPDV
jgi:hypothetical protein